jgi:hypothetical protein
MSLLSTGILGFIVCIAYYVLNLRNRQYIAKAVFPLSLLLLTACQTAAPNQPAPTPTEAPLRVLQYTNEAALDLFYPDGWTFYLPRQGILLFGEEKTINKGEPGAMMTILRVEPTAVHGNAEGELNHFLDFGPKRDGYTAGEAMQVLEINGRSALSQRLSYPGEGENIPMETSVVAAEVESGAVYIFASTAPADVWEANAKKFDVMVSSVSFNE